MIYRLTFSALFLWTALSACSQGATTKEQDAKSPTPKPSEDTIKAFSYINPEGKTIETRFPAPPGFERDSSSSASFGTYLRDLPLKPDGSPVLTYNGTVKGYQDGQCAVVNLPIGRKDLHQCADAVMRLRAEYLWKQKRYDEIGFHLVSGFYTKYTPWMNGSRVSFQGGAHWVQSATAANTYQDFWKYMEFIFTYASTLSLSREMKSIQPKEMAIGDVFIKGGAPGHCVIVVDMVRNPETGEKKFLLAQSYMPAQEIQVLRNPETEDMWYTVVDGGNLETPEWSFTWDQLKRF